MNLTPKYDYLFKPVITYSPYILLNNMISAIEKRKKVIHSVIH